MRRIIKDKYGFEKLYTQGLSIKSPLDINFQIEAIKALRNGIESYDRRHGWRGPITNRNLDSNWKKKLDDFEIDPTLKWEKAEVIALNENFLNLKTKKNENIQISKTNLNWAIKNKSINDVFDLGDFVFLKKKIVTNGLLNNILM